MSLLVPLTLTACQNWPTWSHLEGDSGVLYAAGENPPEATVWTEGDALAAGPDAASVELAPGEGLTFDLQLSGAGTSSGSAAGGDTACDGLSSEFPPGDRGAYAGDVRWLPLTVSDPATLCLEATWDSGHTIDLVLYDVSECAVPRGPVEDPTSGVVLGYDSVDGAAWAAGVVAGPTYAVAIAAAAPSDNGVVPLRVGVAAAWPGVSGGDSGACPSLPAEET